MIAPDFSSIGAGLDAGPIIALILVGGTIVIGVGFGIWTSGSVGRFFSGVPADPLKDKSSPEYRAWYEEKLRREREEHELYRREHSEQSRAMSHRPARQRREDRREEERSYDGPSVADLFIADALASSSAPTSSSSDSAPSDFSGGGGDFGGGGASGDW